MSRAPRREPQVRFSASRWVPVLGATALAACASIAGLEEGDPPDTNASPTAPSASTPPSSTATSSSGTSGTASSGGPADAGFPEPILDAGPDVLLCAIPGQRCDKPEDCCGGNVCREDRQCQDSCKPLGDICLTTTNNCCFGSFCATSLGCKKCIEPGEAAERIAGIPNNKSCCSREVSFLGNCK